MVVYMGGEPKVPSSKDDAQASILSAAIAELRSRRGAGITIDAVARRAGCAKGLVHYHYKTKSQLLSAAAKQMWLDRANAWTRALGDPDPGKGISGGWKLLLDESKSATGSVCAALGMHGDELVGRSVSEGRAEFSRSLARSVDTLVGRMGLEPTVPARELGTLLAATVEGIELQLGAGAEHRELEQAWAAFWVGMLALTRTRGR